MNKTSTYYYEEICNAAAGSLIIEVPQHYRYGRGLSRQKQSIQPSATRHQINRVRYVDESILKIKNAFTLTKACS